MTNPTNTPPREFWVTLNHLGKPVSAHESEAEAVRERDMWGRTLGLPYTILHLTEPRALVEGVAGHLEERFQEAGVELPHGMLDSFINQFLEAYGKQ